MLRQALAATRSIAEHAAARVTAVADQIDQIGTRIRSLLDVQEAQQASTSAGALTSVVAVAGEWAVTEAVDKDGSKASIRHLQKPNAQISLAELGRTPSAAVTDLRGRLGTWTADDDAAIAVAIAIHGKYPYFWLSGPSGFKHTDKQAS